VSHDKLLITPKGFHHHILCDELFGFTNINDELDWFITEIIVKKYGVQP
jgi:hypothetical protein